MKAQISLHIVYLHMHKLYINMLCVNIHMCMFANVFAYTYIHMIRIHICVYIYACIHVQASMGFRYLCLPD